MSEAAQASQRRVPAAVAVTGGAGPLGRHFIRHLLDRTSLPVRALVHRTPLPADLHEPRVVACSGSLLDRASLDRWLCDGATLVHLAWSSSMSSADHVRSMTLLADAAATARVARFVHCSTAVVAGRTRARVVTEDTPCEPVTEYEREKYQAEQTITRAAGRRFPLTIVRPTAVFGAGLQNLLSLVRAVDSGRPLVNYARSSLYARRNLHLVPVETVVAALGFVAFEGDAAGRDSQPRYIVSADDEAGTDFASVEARIRRGLDRPRRLAPLPLPSFALRGILAAAGRSDTDPQRVYDGSRLRRAGFIPPVDFGEAVDRYVRWYRSSASSERTA